MAANGLLRKLFLAALGAIVSGTPAVFALAHAAQTPAQSGASPSVMADAAPAAFDVASVKADHVSGNSEHVSANANSFLATGVTAKRLIEFAYDVRDFQISGGPDWIGSEKYAINAKVDEETLEAVKKLPPAQASQQQQIMLQSLLAERFKLKISHSSKELPTYALLVANSGSRLSPADPAKGKRGFSSNKRGEVHVTGTTMSRFADWLSRQLGRKVIDKTGLQGNYDFTLHWAQERLTPLPGGAAESTQGAATLSPDSGPSIFTALQEQLGLKLESQKGPVEILIIDSIERPSEN